MFCFKPKTSSRAHHQIYAQGPNKTLLRQWVTHLMKMENFKLRARRITMVPKIAWFRSFNDLSSLDLVDLLPVSRTYQFTRTVRCIWLPVDNRIHFKLFPMCRASIAGLSPDYISELFPPVSNCLSSYRLEFRSDFIVSAAAVRQSILVGGGAASPGPKKSMASRRDRPSILMSIMSVMSHTCVKRFSA